MKYQNFFIFLAYVIAPKFCVNCVYFVTDKHGDKYGTCRKFPIEKTDDFLITGKLVKEEDKFNYCSTARKFDHMCGKRGKKFHSVDDLL